MRIKMPEQRIKDCLIALQDAISSSDAPAITNALAKLDIAAKEERKSLDAQLRHYLKNRSYQKALMYLNGEANIPAGNCGGGKAQR